MAKKKSETEGLETADKLETLNTASENGDNAESSPGAQTALIDEDENGNRFLPGSEIVVPVEIKPLIKAVREIETVLKPNFGKARDALTAAQDKVSELAHKNIEHFSEPDEKGTRTYKYGGCIVKITFEKEKIVTKLDEEE